MAIFRSALQKLGSYLLTVSDEPERRTPERTPFHHLSESAFEQQACRLMQAQNAEANGIVAGSVQLLGLSEIRRSVGDGPHSVASVVRRIAEQVIKKNLAEDDAFFRNDDETFLLCFASDSKHAAETTTKLIAAEITARLKAEAPDAALRVDQTVAQIDHGSLEAGHQSIVGAIAAALQKVREEAEQTIVAWRQHLLRNATVRYSPVWSPTKHVVSMYRTMLDPETGRQALRRLNMISNSDDLTIVLFELDCLLVGHAIQALHTLLSHSGTVQILIPINLGSLNNRAHRQEYLGLCQNFPESYKKLLLFELHSAPPGTGVSRIVDLALMLKVHSGGVIIEAQPDAERLQELAVGGLHGISINGKSLPQKPLAASQRLSRVMSAAKACGLKVFVHGADTVGLAEAAASSQVDWVDGRGLALPVSEPRSAYRINPYAASWRAGA
jgi:GGDEF domain-containing protein